MSWWRRLLGREASPGDLPAAPKVRVPVYRSVVADELAVRVYTHAVPRGLESVPCWSYVSEGLRRHDQQEMVFTLRRRPDESEADFPADPLAFFEKVYRAAEHGRRVFAGDSTTFTPSAGFLGRTGLVGFAYLPAEPLREVDYPAPPLAAILLTEPEAAVVGRVGTHRVLGRLGRANTYFPCPPWSDRDRPSVVSADELEGSLLAHLPVTPFRHASVCLQGSGPAAAAPGPGQIRSVSSAAVGDRLTLRVARGGLADVRGLLGELPAEEPFAWLTVPDARANTRLVWRPGQEQIETIHDPRGGGPLRVTGGFLAVFPDAEADEGGQFREDGFLLRLRPEAWPQFRDALARGKRWSLAAGAGAGFSFRLEWDESPALKVLQGILYQPDAVLRERVDIDRVSDLFRLMEEVLTDCFEEWPEGAGQALTLVVAIRPGRRMRFWPEFHPGGLPADLLAALRERLERLPAPEVRGPFAHAMQCHVWGGPPGESEGFVFLPREWADAAARLGRELTVPDDILPLVWPEGAEPPPPMGRP